MYGHGSCNVCNVQASSFVCWPDLQVTRVILLVGTAFLTVCHLQQSFLHCSIMFSQEPAAGKVVGVAWGERMLGPRVWMD